MREFEKGREGKTKQNKKKNRREKRNGLKQFEKEKEFKTFFLPTTFRTSCHLLFSGIDILF